jgi:hypothetical protein
MATFPSTLPVGITPNVGFDAIFAGTVVLLHLKEYLDISGEERGRQPRIQRTNLLSPKNPQPVVEQKKKESRW